MTFFAQVACGLWAYFEQIACGLWAYFEQIACASRFMVEVRGESSTHNIFGQPLALTLSF